MKPAIRVENLSKVYHLGTGQGGYRTLRETIVDAAAAPWRRLRRLCDAASNAQSAPANGTPASAHWALTDVSFDIQPGEVVGVIGRNGAGKSTLLKILSRITEPTTGRAVLHGRVGSLLEVGTGFHHELTGRENIFLSGAILGMSRREIQRKFEEIVSFAEIEQFLDTPVKRYSSGMYVRLAFAVAANLEPEILIVDEVLAVGDQSFQKKCLGKMGEVSRSGRTVLLVSHQMASIANLCRTVALLEQGRLAYFGNCEEAVARYSQSCASPAGGEVDLSEHANRRPGAKPILRSLRMLNNKKVVTDHLRSGKPVIFEIDVDAAEATFELQVALIIEDCFGSRLFTLGTYLTDSVLPVLSHRQRLRCFVEELALPPGRYALTLWAGPIQDVEMDAIQQAAMFDVVEDDYYGNGRLPNSARGRFLVRSHWSVVGPASSSLNGDVPSRRELAPDQ